MFKAYYKDFDKLVTVYAVDRRGSDLNNPYGTLFLIYHPNPHIRPDARWIWVTATAFTPERDEDGLAISSSLEQADERHKLEQVLKDPLQEFMDRSITRVPNII